MDYKQLYNGYKKNLGEIKMKVFTKKIDNYNRLFINDKIVDNIDCIPKKERIEFMKQLKKSDHERLKWETDKAKQKDRKTPVNEVEERTRDRNINYIKRTLATERITFEYHVLISEGYQKSLAADIILLTTDNEFILIDFKPTDSYETKGNYSMEFKQIFEGGFIIQGFALTERKCKRHYLAFIDDYTVAFIKLSHNNRTILKDAYENGEIKLSNNPKIVNDTNYKGTKKVKKHSARIGLRENTKIFEQLDKTIYYLETKIDKSTGKKSIFAINKTIFTTTPDKLADELKRYIDFKIKFLHDIKQRFITKDETISIIEEFANVKIQEPECRIIAMNCLENLHIKDKVTCKNIFLWQRDMLLLSMVNCVSIKDYWILLKEIAYKNITIK